jgi:serine/threonine protein kinase
MPSDKPLSVKLQYVSAIRDESGKNKLATLHLLGEALPEKGHVQLYELGSGRYARVLFACEGDISGAADLMAVKFIQKDNSEAFTRTSRERFLQEVVSTSQLTSVTDAGFFIPYRGFGCIGPFSTASLGLHAQNVFRTQNASFANPVITGWSESEFNAVCNTNMASLEAAAPQMLERVVGEFMVMKLAFGTLDDLLLFRTPWDDNKAISVPIQFNEGFREKVHKSKKDYLEAFLDAFTVPPELPTRINEPFQPKTFKKRLFSRDVVEEQRVAELEKQTRAEEERRRLRLSTIEKLNKLEDYKERRGFDQLEALSRIESIGESFRATVLVELFASCVTTLMSVHHSQNPARRYAHRDLKPGNFLIGSIPSDDSIYLSDLGFVASQADIINDRYTRSSNSKDPGVLTPGTKGFRAPEHIVSGDEITFEIAAGSPATLHVYPVSGTAPENGDSIESQDVTFSTKNDAFFSSRIYSVKPHPEGDRYIATPAYTVEPLSKRSYYKGTLLKDVGFHSDIFSMGCLLYFLFTSGREAEHALSVLTNPAFLEGFDKLPSYRASCLSIALKMSLEDPETIDSQLRAYFGTDNAIFEKKMSEHDAMAAYKDVMKGKGGRTNYPEGSYVRGLLCTGSGIPIPVLVLWIVMCCCIRNRIDSICRSESRAPDSSFLFSSGEWKAAEALRTKVKSLSRCREFNGNPPLIGIVGVGTALQLFAGFRLFAKDLIGIARKCIEDATSKPKTVADPAIPTSNFTA